MVNCLDTPLIAIIGVRKCGTTSVFDVLAKHPDIAAAMYKESQFFACDPETVGKNLNWYRSLFENTGAKYALDGSTWYFTSLYAVENLRRHQPDAKIIICLRDPVERTFSAYLHMKKQTPRLELRSFEKVLVDIKQELQNERHRDSLYNAENATLRDAVKEKKVFPQSIAEDFHKNRFGANFATNLSDPLAPFRYFGESLYQEWLNIWRERFPESVHVVCLESFQTDPKQELDKVLNFLHFSPYDFGPLAKSNTTKLPRGPFASLILQLSRQSKIGASIRDLLYSIGLEKLLRRLRDDYFFKPKEALIPEHREAAQALLDSATRPKE